MTKENFNGEWVELELGQDCKVNIWIKCEPEMDIKEKRKDAFNKIKEKMKDYIIKIS